MALLDGLVNAACTVFKDTAVTAAGATAYGLSGQDPNAGGYQFMGDLVYPSDLINEDIGRKAFMCIKFSQYQRRSIFDQPFFKSFGGITLPIPSSLQDMTSVNWNSTSTSSSSAAVGAAAEQYLNQRNSSGSPASGNFFDTVKQELQNAGGAQGLGNIATGAGLAYGASELSKAFGGGGAQALQMAGLAYNPFLTMLFQSPNFKSHSFSWTLAPRNPEESSTIASIVAAFKYNMLPGLSGQGSGGTFFTYPNIANITLFPTDYYLYKFKPCAIKSFTADFAPNGPSFFKGTYAPTHINISVDMTEIEMWTKESLSGVGSFAGVNPALGQALSTAADIGSNIIDNLQNNSSNINGALQTLDNVMTLG